MSDDKYIMGHLSFSPDYRARRELDRTIDEALDRAAPIHFAACAAECEIKKGKQVEAAAPVTCTWCRGWMTAKDITIPRTNPRQRQLFKESV